jgi:general secretion pathway protein C
MRIRLPVARLVSVLLFAALCAIVAGWALQLLAPRTPIAPGGAVAQAQPATDLSAAGQLFGGAPRQIDRVAEGPTNIQVAGVLAAGSRGVALLAVDGRPAKPFAVGEAVTDGTTVRSVSGDAVELERGGRPMRLAAPARGSLDVLTSGPQRAAAGTAAATPPQTLPPLPPRALPPAGAAAAEGGPGGPFQLPQGAAGASLAPGMPAGMPPGASPVEPPPPTAQ